MHTTLRHGTQGGVTLKVYEVDRGHRMVFSVPHREDGREVLAALEEQTYDIIFMNCQMPEMDGEATRQIRKLSSSAPPRIIAMTANALAGDEGKMSLRGHG